MFTGVSSTDESAIDTLFGEQTPGADNLLGASKTEKKSESPDAEEKEENIDASQTLTDEDAVDELFGGDKTDVEETPIPDKPKPVSKKADSPAPADSALEVDYEALYQKMVDDGVWAEVEIGEGTKWDANVFKEVQKLQTQSQYEDLLDKTGPTGKMIIEYEQNGGNPSEILSLFREQRDIRDFDISDRSGQEEFMRSYLESQGNSERSIERTIKALTDQGEEAFREEAEEKKALWDSQYEGVIAEKAKEQKLFARQAEEDVKNFHKSITTAITTDTEVTPKERKELNNYILNYSQPHRGKQVSQFYLDMLEVQKEPAKYLELAKFIKGLKTGEYKKKIESKVTREVSAKSFMKIKNGAALTSSGGNHSTLNSAEESSFIAHLKGNRK